MRGVWENVPPFIPRQRFFVVVVPEISSRTLNSTLYARISVTETTAAKMFPEKLRVSPFPDIFPTPCLDSGIISPLRLRWVKGVCVFRCNLPPALLVE